MAASDQAKSVPGSDGPVEAALSLARARRAGSTDRLAELVRIESPTGEEGPAQAYMAKRLAEAGAEVTSAEPDIALMFDCFPEIAQYPTHWKHDLILPYDHLPTLAALKASGLEAVLNYRGRPNVVGHFKGAGGGRSLILNGHTDTVTIEPAQDWTRAPYGAEIADGRMYGRGTSDMKGGVMAALLAMTYLREAGVKLRGDVIFQSVVNEEHAGNGTLDLVCRGWTADAALVLEPTHNRIFVSHPGGLYWQVEITGVARSPGARWSKDGLEGVSAIEKLPQVIAALLAVEQEINARVGVGDEGARAFSLVMGKIEGGHYETVTAPKALIKGGAYFAPRVGRVTDVMAHLSAAVSETNRADPFLSRHPARLTFLHHDDSTEQAPTIPIARALAATLARRGGESEIAPGPFCCDMRHLVNQGGIPSAIFGPGSIAQAHKADEYIVIEEYLEAIEHLIAFIADWCGTCDS